MSECYPTGCNPCTEPISFPESPADGDRHCVPQGSNSEDQKCWVYDQCIPGWRAEGPTPSPNVFLGILNACVAKPSDLDEEAGMWFIASSSCDTAHTSWGISIGSVTEGDRIVYNGTIWQSFSPQNIPYASAAVEETPDPDNRISGIVKLASLEEAVSDDDTEKSYTCHAITPYTLIESLKQRYDQGEVTLSWLKDLPTSTVSCPGTVVLSVQAQGLLEDGTPGLGKVDYQWYKNDVALEDSDTIKGAKTATLEVSDVTGSADLPFENLFEAFTAQDTDEFYVIATWAPGILQSTATPLTSKTTVLAVRPEAVISTQPTDGAAENVGDTGTFTVGYELSGTCPGDCDNQWTVLWMADNTPIQEGQTITGITFTNVTADTLNWEITGAAENVYVRASVTASASCNETQLSNEVRVLASSAILPPNGTVNFTVNGKSDYTNSVGFVRIEGYFDPTMPNISKGNIGFKERNRASTKTHNFWSDAVYKLVSASSNALKNQTRIDLDGRRLRFEDIPGGGDGDYNDLIIKAPVGGGKFTKNYNGQDGVFYVRSPDF